MKKLFSLEDKEIKNDFLDNNENYLVSIKISGKNYNIEEISKIIDENIFIENKVVLIKQYMLENLLDKEEQYISLEIIMNKKDRFISINKSIYQRCKEEMIDFFLSNGIGPATVKTLIRSISEFIIRDFFDYGLLYDILKKTEITNIKIENGFILYTEIGSIDTKIWNKNKLNNKDVEKLITKISRNSVGLSTSSPIIDTILPKLNYRVNMILKSLTSSSTHVVSIRKNYDFLNFEYYEKSDYFPQGYTSFFKSIVKNKKNILIAGGTGSGKTSLMNAIAKDLINDTESVIVIEDTPEVYVNKPAFVGFYSKDHVAKIEDLFKASLRQQPDRILVGEIRDGNMAYYMIQAMNTGHDGNISTIHASSASQAIIRLSNLLKQSSEAGEYDEKTISSMIRHSIDYIIFVGKVKEGDLKKHKLLEILKIKSNDPSIKYREKLNILEEFIFENKENDQLIHNSLDYINYVDFKMKYSLVEYDEILKYDHLSQEYVINNIDKLSH